jgi:hypothetical protein
MQLTNLKNVIISLYDNALHRIWCCCLQIRTQLLYDTHFCKTGKASFTCVTIKHKKFTTYILIRGQLLHSWDVIFTIQLHFMHILGVTFMKKGYDVQDGGAL